MRELMLAVSRRAVKALKAVPMPGLAVLLALVLAAVVNMALPMPVSAAIALRGSITTGTTVNTSLTIDKPNGVAAGDVMIVNITKTGNSITAPSSDGWTLIAGSSLGGPSARYGAVLYRMADGTEGASFTFALGTGTSGAVGSIVAFSGVDTSGGTPFDVAPGSIQVEDSQVAVVADSITTASADAAVIMFGMAADSGLDWSDWATTSPGALTELYESEVGGASGASVGAAWATKTSAGVTGDGAAKLSSAERNGGILIALKPVSPTTLTVAPATGTYGDTASLTATLSPAVAGKTISFTLNGVAAGTGVTDGSGVANIPAASLSGIDAGSYPTGLGASYAGEADYSASSGMASLTVEPRDVTVTADEESKVYGDADPALTYHISSGSLVAGDAFSGGVARTAGEDVGTYAIRRGALALSSNYNLTFIDGPFTINVRDIVVKADDSGKLYGKDDPALTYEITSGSLAAGDTFSGKLARVAGEDVGTYAIQQGTLALGGNYNFTFVEGMFTISLEKTEDPSTPVVDGISPQSGQPGDTLDVVIRGSNFTGATAVNFGPGVTVNSFDVESATRIVAHVAIDPAAGEGENNIIVTTPSGEGQLAEAFSIDLSAGTARRGGLWFLLILMLLAAALGLLIFALVKRRKKGAEPELAPIVAPSRPMGGAREAVVPAESSAAPVDQPLGEAIQAAEPEQALVVAAADEPPGETVKAAEPEQAPAAAIEPPAEDSANLPEESAVVAAARKPRRRTTKKAPASTSGRPRTPAKKRKKASG